MLTTCVYFWSHMYATIHTTWNTVSWSSFTSTSLYDPTHKDTFSHNHTKNTAKRPSYTISPSTIIHTSLSTQWSFTGTRKHPSHYSQNITRLHPMSVWNPSPNTAPMVGALHLQTHGVSRNPRVQKHQNKNLFFKSVLLLCCWRMIALQKFLHSIMGRYLIYFLWIS